MFCAEAEVVEFLKKCVKTTNTAFQRATCSVVLIEHDSVI